MKPISRLLNVLDVAVILGSLLIITVLSIELLSPAVVLDHREVLTVQLVVCVVFLSDFFVRLIVTPNKKRYLKRNFIFFLISIPVLNIVYYTQEQVSSELYFLLRLLPLIRGGYGIAIVISFLSRSRITSLFLTYVVTIFSFTYFASLVFFSLERGVNPDVKSYGDALWWAFMNVTTVGSNIYAVGAVGRVMSVVLAGAGMMMFPIFTGYILSVFKTVSTEGPHPPLGKKGE